MLIDSQTKLVGVIGWPIAHSLSPQMHNAAFDALGLNWRYVACPAPPGRVKAAIEGLEALGFYGCNVTVPHKEAVIPFLDDLAEHVRHLGAVNTLIFKREKEACTISGDNTDVPGFILPLRQRGFEPQGKKVLIVGAGGVARGAVYSLCAAGASSVTVLNRTPARADALVADLSTHARQTDLGAGALTPEALIEQSRQADLLVNATVLGMWPRIDASIWPDQQPIPAHLVVYDLIYRPLETRLLHQARQAGALGIAGLGMLVAQGALSFELWTGRRPPQEVMRKACERVLS